MEIFYAGQVVRIKTVDELCEEFDLELEDLQRGTLIGLLTFEERMLSHVGEVYTIDQVDSDGCIYIDSTHLWWAPEVLVLVSEPGTYYGFKVGDRVEFRNYDDMVADDSIRINWFVENMKPLCGTTGTITDIRPRNKHFAEVFMNNEDGEQIHWRLNTLCIQHIEEVPDVQTDDWAAILGS